MRRTWTVVIVIGVIVTGSFAGYVEYAHQKTQRPRLTIARAPFGRATGCAPDDAAERICRWAREVAPVVNDAAERERVLGKLLDSMCNPPVIGMFKAIASLAPKDKPRLLRAGVAEAGGHLDCPELERVWLPATTVPSPRAP